MSKPEQLPLCNGGPETLGRTDGTWQFVGQVMGASSHGAKNSYAHDIQVAHKEAQDSLKEAAKDIGATAVVNVKHTHVIIPIGKQSSVITLTGDAMCFVPDGETS